MNTTESTVRVEDLRDGDTFSTDGGKTWHVCAVVLYGNVAVYVNERRGPRAMTTRIDAERTDEVTVSRS